MLSCLVRQHKYELFHALFYSPLSIAPKSVRLLESQLQVERHHSDVLRQEAEGPRKSLQNSDAYFLVQQQVLEDLSAKQEKLNKLDKHLASIMGT